MDIQKKAFLHTFLGIGFSLLISAQTLANQTSEYVKSVSLGIDGINYHQVILKNVSANKHIDAIQIQPQQTEIEINLAGHVSCIEDNDIQYDTAKAYFGPVSLFIDSIQSPQALYSATYGPTTTYGKGKSRLISEAGNFESFKVPLAQIKQGHPAVRFNPMEELNKKLQQHINQGGTKLSFYQNDQDIGVERKVSMAGWCRLKGSNTSKAGFASTTVYLVVKYEGDPELKLSGTLNAQLANNMPNQINNNLPMKLDKADFQPNIPHHYGQCIPKESPVIQINLQFSGNDTALLDLKVVPVSNTYADYGTYYEFSSIPVNSQYSKHINFTFPLNAMLSQDKYSYMAISNNKVWNHNMKIMARVKPNEGEWSQWQDYDTAIFKHRCEPQVQFHSPGEVGGFQHQNGNTDPVSPSPSRVIPAAIKPELKKIQAPVKPDPAPSPTRIQPVEDEPEAQLQLRAIPQ
ncbi:hypothetical protein [Methylophaga sp. OBS4]|uniref:hypothetical protein n=1 Tax=Methylophaga sp. OBS4 TaxID=2991935 RepID=UPI0022524B59|nr:hypothetical protein [Methylophaga sp. OBS4]MCX4187495.1 hypothetical protein [Methylophaga sp. OBS4]